MRRDKRLSRDATAHFGVEGALELANFNFSFTTIIFVATTFSKKSEGATDPSTPLSPAPACLFIPKNDVNDTAVCAFFFESVNKASR